MEAPHVKIPRIVTELIAQIACISVIFTCQSFLGKIFVDDKNFYIYNFARWVAEKDIVDVHLKLVVVKKSRLPEPVPVFLIRIPRNRCPGRSESPKLHSLPAHACFGRTVHRFRGTLT